jgi:glutamate--cysteine ligase
MSVPQKGGEPISGRDDLVRYLEAGNKPPNKFRIGTEHEKFGFRRADNTPIPYAGPAGIRAMLEGLTEFGWEPILEGEYIIGLKHGEGAISLEPGGQLELSGAPLKTYMRRARRCTSTSTRSRPSAGAWGSAFSAWAPRPNGRGPKRR